MKSERDKKKDITQKPNNSDIFHAFEDFGRLLRERIPGLGIPGAKIIFDEADIRAEEAVDDMLPCVPKKKDASL